jgi:asparagine synthase (glutamine-hydrolysing)
VLGAALGPGDRRDHALRLYAALRGLFPAAQLGGLLSPTLSDLGLLDLDPAVHLSCALSSGQVCDLPPDELFSYLEITNYLSNTLLRDADVMSMVHGVELRVPLCDHVLVSQVMGLPAGVRVRHGRKKPLLVDACHNPLVAAAAGRRKRGFVLPLDSWLHGALRHEVGRLLADPAPCRAAGLRPEAVLRLWQEYLHGRAPGATWRIWAIFTLLSWVRLHGLEI